MTVTAVPAEEPALEDFFLLSLPGVEEIAAEELPQPYRRLLAHDQDMTSTLRRHHGEELVLRVIAKRHAEPYLERRVVLAGVTSGRPVEYGAIRIALSPFEAAARAAILESRRPLGAILADFSIPYVSRPEAFLRLESGEEMERALELSASDTVLFGRSNVLRSPGGAELARVLEILPPSAPPAERD